MISLTYSLRRIKFIEIQSRREVARNHRGEGAGSDCLMSMMFQLKKMKEFGHGG